MAKADDIKADGKLAEKKPEVRTDIPFALLYGTADGSAISLTYRLPTGRDMRLALEVPGAKRYETLLSNLFEVDAKSFDNLDGRDFMRLIKLADSFFDPSLPT